MPTPRPCAAGETASIRNSVSSGAAISPSGPPSGTNVIVPSSCSSTATRSSAARPRATPRRAARRRSHPRARGTAGRRRRKVADGGELVGCGGADLERHGGAQASEPPRSARASPRPRSRRPRTRRRAPRPGGRCGGRRRPGRSPRRSRGRSRRACGRGRYVVLAPGVEREDHRLERGARLGQHVLVARRALGVAARVEQARVDQSPSAGGRASWARCRGCAASSSKRVKPSKTSRRIRSRPPLADRVEAERDRASASAKLVAPLRPPAPRRVKRLASPPSTRRGRWRRSSCGTPSVGALTASSRSTCSRVRVDVERGEVVLELGDAARADDRHAARWSSARRGARSQAIATCAGGTPSSSAIASTSSTIARLLGGVLGVHQPLPVGQAPGVAVAVLAGQQPAAERRPQRRRRARAPRPSAAARGRRCARRGCTRPGCRRSATSPRSSAIVCARATRQAGKFDSPAWRILPRATRSSSPRRISSIGVTPSWKCTQ